MFVLLEKTGAGVHTMTTNEYINKDKKKVPAKAVTFVEVGKTEAGATKVATAFAENDTHVVVWQQG